MRSFLVVTATVLLGACALMLVFLVWRAVARGVRHRRRTSLVDAGAAALAAVAADPAVMDTAPDALDPLRRLRARELDELILRLARGLSGENHDAVVEAATRLGVLDRATGLIGDRRWWRRLRGARVLTALRADANDAGDVDEITRLLEDRHPLVRAQAAEWTAAHPSPARIDAVIGLLDDADAVTVHAAQDALIRIGAPAERPVARALAESADLGRDGRLALLEVGGALHSPSLGGPASELAWSPDPRVREHAASILGAAGTDGATTVLASLLDDPVAGVRRSAAAALGESGDWRAAGRLGGALDDADFAARRAAGLSLLRLGAPGTVVLRSAASSGTPRARDMAARVLEQNDFEQRWRQP